MRIDSNGSHWVGEEPDSLETLLDVLKKQTLDPSFEEYGRFFYQCGPNEFHAFGNFLGYSHVFNIFGTLEEMLPLARALREARKRPEYLRAWAQMYRGEPRKEWWQIK